MDVEYGSKLRQAVNQVAWTSLTRGYLQFAAPWSGGRLPMRAMKLVGISLGYGI
jgi:hypothetical protein